MILPPSSRPALKGAAGSEGSGKGSCVLVVCIDLRRQGRGDPEWHALLPVYPYGSSQKGWMYVRLDWLQPQRQHSGLLGGLFRSLGTAGSLDYPGWPNRTAPGPANDPSTHAVTNAGASPATDGSSLQQKRRDR